MGCSLGVSFYLYRYLCFIYLKKHLATLWWICKYLCDDYYVLAFQLECREEKEPPSTLMWTLFLLAQVFLLSHRWLVFSHFLYTVLSATLFRDFMLVQHYDRRGRYDIALTKIDEAIEHTPTVIDLYSVKVCCTYVDSGFIPILLIHPMAAFLFSVLVYHLLIYSNIQHFILLLRRLTIPFCLNSRWLLHLCFFFFLFFSFWYGNITSSVIWKCVEEGQALLRWCTKLVKSNQEPNSLTKLTPSQKG